VTAGRRTCAALLLCLLGASCIPSNVVAVEERMVVDDLAALEWAPAADAAPDGLYETVEITGEAAASLRKVYYLFLADGTYTAAALTEAGGEYAFQTIGGTWSAGPEGLALDGGDPVLLERAGDHIRISAPTGTVVMLRQKGWR